MKPLDYIIVGQGIAGSCLAIRLLELGKNILVIDEANKNSSSRIAAGMFNPVTGQKMVKTWLADVLFPSLHEFYQQIQRDFQADFYYPSSLYRPFLSAEEQNEWMGRSIESEYASYIERIFTTEEYKQVRNKFGGLLLKQTGYINTTAFIAAVSDRIRKSGILLNESFDFGCLRPEHDVVFYRDQQAAKIIFCQGVSDNPWFNWLPIKPLKGETISIKSPFDKQLILNRGVYILPKNQEGLQRVGSTYKNHDRVDGITTAARQELEEKVNSLVTFPYEVVDHQWGWRPTTPDHRPMLGSHPKFASMVIFNGLGTKGISLAPYFSKVLTSWMEKQMPLNKEVDIERYKSLYWKSPK